MYYYYYYYYLYLIITNYSYNSNNNSNNIDKLDLFITLVLSHVFIYLFRIISY